MNNISLNSIGFYTLSENRCKSSNMESNIMRGEIILTERCNFSCPYCRSLRDDIKGDMPFNQAMSTLKVLIKEGLRNIRFSGGEPTMYKGLKRLILYCKENNVERIALSTNGSAKLDTYKKLIDLGVNDLSISLDSCCASFNKEMTGGIDAFDIVTKNIYEISKLTYVTAGIVITESNYDSLVDIVKFAHNLGVADIRIIPSAQDNMVLEAAKQIPQEILESHPILKYRVYNILNGIHIRGLSEKDAKKCGLVLDDVAIAGNYHFPCIIYMREQGDPIGLVDKNIRIHRNEWYKSHNTHNDPICSKNCLDVCAEYNRKFEKYKEEKHNEKQN